MMALMPSGVRRVMTGRVPGNLRIVGVLALAAGVWGASRLGWGLALLAGAPEGAGAVSAPAPRRLPGGALVICGGGKLPDRVRDRFVELAGGREAKIVVIPTAHSYADRAEATATLLDPWKARHVASVRLFHTRARQEADDPNFIRPLQEATGVWITGGAQARLTEVYLGTQVERQLKALLSRGGVVGGTSAGAAVMSRVMITSGRGEARLGEGFDLLPGAVIDQHFLRRNRMSRLVSAVRKHPDLIGLGIDEQTAVVVDVHGRRLSVLGDSYVVACVADRPPAPADLAATARAAVADTHVDFLKAGDEADLGALSTRGERAVASAIDLDAL